MAQISYHDPAFVRWLIAKYLKREIIDLHGIEKLPERLACRVMRGQWLDQGNGVSEMITSAASEQQCLDAAFKNYRAEVAKRGRP